MTARLQLPARLDTRAASDLAEALHGHVGSDLILDAGAVSHIGALTVQTLMVAAASWAADGHAFAIEALPDEAADQIRLFGVSAEGLTAGKVGV